MGNLKHSKHDLDISPLPGLQKIQISRFSPQSGFQEIQIKSTDKKAVNDLQPQDSFFHDCMLLICHFLGFINNAELPANSEP